MLIHRMASPTKVVLLACGSFNPPTNMHLRMFELGKDALNKTERFNVISGIVSPVSDGYGKKDLIPAKMRCTMVRLALKTSKWIRVDPWECEQSKWLETVKVLKHHRNVINEQCKTNSKPAPTKKRRKNMENENINEDDLGRIDNCLPKNLESNVEDVRLKLLCGADLLESFAVPGLWKEEDIEEIVSKYGLVCITRAGSDPKKFIYESDVLTKYQDNIFIVTEWIQNEISATKIRRALRRQESVKYLMQDSVIDYIHEHQLYGLPDNKAIDHIVPSPSTDDLDGTEARNIANLPNIKFHSSVPTNSFDDTEPPRSPKRLMGSADAAEGPPSPKTPRHIPCMTDIGQLVRRVKNVRIAFAPETCV